MSWDPLPSTFDRARRREAYRRFARIVTGREAQLLALDSVKDRLGFFEQSYVGIRPIPLKAIVGTAGRGKDFDRDFLPRRSDLRERWTRIERAFPEGGWPPIVVYKLGNSYFVVDGHHRVAIARQRRYEFIDAEVTELRTRYEIPDGADIGLIIYKEQQQTFMRDSGLERVRPDAQIEFSQPHRYVELLELVKLHGYHLMRERNEIVSVEEVAADWYDRVYRPTVEQIHHQELDEVWPGQTEADLWLHVWQRRRALFPDRGGVSLREAVETVRSETRGRGRRAIP
jgi:hypothetical protein